MRDDAPPAEVALDGRSLTPAQVAAIADGAAVRTDPGALERAAAAHRILIAAACGGAAIYGLTVGVGLNKDRTMVDARGGLSQAALDASRAFNAGLLRAHCGGVGEPMSVRAVRAAMAVRLNTLLTGGSGAHPAVIDAHAAFLNQGITPLLPSEGSVGEGDITLLSHVGLAMLGEGEVFYRGKRMAAGDALRASGTPAIAPYARDALAILGVNACSAAAGALALDDLAHLLRVNVLTYALSLQALNGNVSPLLADALALRPYPEAEDMGRRLRALLAGSSLWRRDARRPLQDPLSFRSGVYLLAELQRGYRQACDRLLIQLNGADDNPGVAVGAGAPSRRPQESAGYVDAGGVRGAVLPGANFEPLPWVLAFEQLGLALAHNTLACAQQLVKLNDPAFTGLSRFLGTENAVHAFGAGEKTAAALAMRSKTLALPVSLDYLPLAGGIEDIATNAPAVVERLRQQIDNHYRLLGILLVHDAQAVDLRLRRREGFALSAPAAALYDAVRRRVPFMDLDRPLAPDFAAAEQVARGYDR